MKLFAWILGIVAVLGSFALGYNWLHTRRGEVTARRDAMKFAADAANAQFAVDLEHHNKRMELENDQLDVRNSELELENAELSGSNTTKALNSLAKARSLVRIDRLLIQNENNMAIFGPDPRVEMAQTRFKAAEESRKVYAGCVVRDQHLAYGFLVVWLAFGFAAALASKT